jgi:plastocyanin
MVVMRKLPVCIALALSLAAASAAHAQNGEMMAGTHHVQQIEIQMSNFAYSPKSIELLSGSDYLLHFVNTGSTGHDFSAPEFFAAGTVAPEDRAKLADGSVEVEGGATVDVRFTATKPGTYKVRCTHFLHTTFGMTGTAVIR